MSPDIIHDPICSISKSTIRDDLNEECVIQRSNLPKE
jgi:hypothetical protein